MGWGGEGFLHQAAPKVFLVIISPKSKEKRQILPELAHPVSHLYFVHQFGGNVRGDDKVSIHALSGPTRLTLNIRFTNRWICKVSFDRIHIASVFN